MPLQSLQTLLDSGMDENKVRAICDDLVEDDSDERGPVLLAYLLDEGEDVSPEEIEELTWGNHNFNAGPREFMVLTDDEADAECKDRIKDTLWAFNANFLSNMTGLPEEVFTALQDQCEGANDTFEVLINGSCGLDDFVANAIQADSRGHHLNGYDGEEYEVTVGGVDFLIYRNN